MWADGLYVKAGLEKTNAALLVVIGALTDGRKVVLAVESGQRESKESWGTVLRDLRTRGLKPWRCTSADGRRTTVLEPSARQRAGCHAEAPPTGGDVLAQSAVVCGDAGGG